VSGTVWGGLGGLVCAVCLRVWCEFGGVRLCCVYESLGLVWESEICCVLERLGRFWLSEFVLGVGPYGVGLGD